MVDEIKQTIVIQAELTKIQQDLKTLEGNFRASFGSIQNIATSALSSLGVGIGLGTFVALGKSVIDLGDKLSDLSDQTGISIATLGGIKPVLDSSNSSLESFSKGIAKAQRSLGDLGGQGKEAADALKAIGLNPQELVNASPDKFLEQLVSALSKVENQNERAAIAFRILGRSAAELVPTLIQLSNDGIKKLDDATADAYKRLGDLRDRMVETAAAATNFVARITVAIGQGLGLIGKSSAQLTQELDHLKKFAPGDIGAQLAKQREIDEAVKRENAPKPVTQGAFKGLLPKTAEKDTGVQDFFAGLQKQIDATDIEFTKLRDGDKIAKEIALDLQFAEFNQKRVAEGKPIASIEEFRKYKDVILSASAALEQFKAQKELAGIEAKLTIGGVDTSTVAGKESARIGNITAEYAQMAVKIGELGETAGKSQEEIADDISLAWKKALNDINGPINEAKKNFEDLQKRYASEPSINRRRRGKRWRASPASSSNMNTQRSESRNWAKRPAPAKRISPRRQPMRGRNLWARSTTKPMKSPSFSAAPWSVPSIR